MKHFRFWLVASCILLVLAPSATHAQASVPRFEPADCPFQIPIGKTIQCGYLVVPEEHARPDGPTIRLGVAIVKSQLANPAPDPLILLNGGPGGQAVQELPRFMAAYSVVVSVPDRDFIIFDQRGVGWSQPSLTCPELTPVLLRRAMGRDLTADEQLAPYITCRDRWLGEGINLAAYNTAESAADVNDLWRALGYTQANLYGTSYGTLLAQTVMRDYPTGIRSVILDSAYPLDISLFADMASNLSQSLKHLFANCAADVLCRATYPDLETVFYRLLDRLTRAPVMVSTTNPQTGERFSFKVGGVELINTLTRIPPRNAPAFVFDVRDGNYEALVESRRGEIEDLYQGAEAFAMGMRLSVVCSQSMYDATPEQLAVSSVYPESVWANDFIQHQFDLCKHWPAHPRGLIDKEAWVTGIPTLVLSGEYDYSLSPTYWPSASLEHALYFRVPGATHGVLLYARSCTTSVAMSFLHDPSRRPNDNCLASAGSAVMDTPFVTRAAAMRLPAQVAIALMSLAAVWTLGAGIITLRRRAHSLPIAFNWRSSLSITGWWPMVGSSALTMLVLIASKTGWLQVEPATVVATVLPPLVAIQAAWLLSPEDEPALEVIMACPRELKWALLERLSLLLAVQGGMALALSPLAAAWSGESFVLTIVRWLPPLILLCGLAVCVTLVARRAVMGVVVTGLVWFAASLLGDAMVNRWPFAWPLHLYLSPDHAEYVLNRCFIFLLGIILILFAASRLLRDSERVLLGSRKVSSQVLGRRTTPRDVNVASNHLPFVVHRSSLTQLGAMLRYEFLLQWRRPTLLALVGGLIAVPILGAFLSRGQFSGYDAAIAAGGLLLEQVRAQITASMLTAVWLGVSMTLLLLLPIVTADAIPRDRQIGVRELLDSLPITPEIYLAGKLLSLWVSLLAGLGLAALAAGITWRWIVGPFNLGIYAEMWLLGAVPLALINSALSVLLAAGQPTNRRAIFVGVGFAIFCLLALLAGFLTHGTLLYHLNPARPAIELYYFVAWPGAEAGASKDLLGIIQAMRTITSRQDVLLSIAAGVAEAGLVWLAVLQWMRRKG